MKFILPGTVAQNTTQDTSIESIESLNITSSEAYDIEAIFQSLSVWLDQMEKQAMGTQEDLERLFKEANRLPRFSEEHLECDIRLKAIQKKWGLNEKEVSKPESDSFSFPIKLDKADAVLIEKMNADYIDSGKEGRLWIQSWMEKQGVTTVGSEDKLNQLVMRAVAELEKHVKAAQSASSTEEWEGALKSLGIQADKLYVSGLFESWLKAVRMKLTTIGQIKKWVSDQETAIIVNHGSTNVLDSRLLDRVINTKE